LETFILVAAGLIGLLVGGDALVKGAVGVAARLGVSPLFIGITLVGFGTSTPELLTSLQAAFAEAPGVAAGNVIGSNIANILLILGGTALLAPIVVEGRSFRRDGFVLIASAILCLVVVQAGALTLPGGLVFLASLIAYLAFCILRERGEAASEEETQASMSVPVSLLWFAGGLAVTLLGARWLVNGAIRLAEGLGVPETIVGLTVVAVGTSLPELVASLAAARKQQAGLAFGNIVGSNIFNVLFILGTTALVRPIAIPAQLAEVDIWVMLAATAALVLTAVTGWRITRAEGAALLTGYAGYTAWLGWSAFG
jgi:cation:H+ antiporter